MDREIDEGERLMSARDDRHSHSVAHEVLARLGDKWSVLVIHMIAGGPIRFTDLKRKVSATRPISARVLTRTLKQLGHDGLIARKVFPVVPPRVEYSLTGLGKGFLGLTVKIMEWSMIHGPVLEAARQSSKPVSNLPPPREARGGWREAPGGVSPPGHAQ
jgi:DNA-binding HxlR family transcriptional regulator